MAVLATRLTKALQRMRSRNTMRCNVVKYPVRARTAERLALGCRPGETIDRTKNFLEE